MKLTSIEIHPVNSSEVAVLSFRDPGATNPYNIRSIVGLDADEIISRYYGASETSKFYNLSLERREIVFKISLNPNFSEFKTYSDLRDDLYKMISSSRTGKIQLQFKNNTDVVAAISGCISKFESPLFEKNQEVILTIKCDEPMLKALDPVVITTLTLPNTVVQDEKSTAPHGFMFELEVIGNIDSIVISDPDDFSWSFEIIPVGGFLINDVLFFSSEYNNKYLYLIREENIIHLADVITPGSMWPILFPGTNFLLLNHPDDLIWNNISYYPTYWGV